MARSEAEVEAVARATAPQWERLGEALREKWRAQARDAINALDACRAEAASQRDEITPDVIRVLLAATDEAADPESGGELNVARAWLFRRLAQEDPS